MDKNWAFKMIKNRLKMALKNFRLLGGRLDFAQFSSFLEIKGGGY